MKKLNIIAIAAILFTCRGKQGEIGPAGSNSRINVATEQPGNNCLAGGFRIEVGIDADNNGRLDTDEIQSIQYVCNGDVGADGRKSLVNINDEPAGGNCSTGGFEIEVGTDTNDDGILDTDEIQSIQYICDGDVGADGQNSLVNVTDEPAGSNCSAGGFKIEAGIDINNNGTLDTDEIQSTQYVCNGGFDKEIRFDFDWPFFGSLSTSSTPVFNDIKTTLIDFNINNYLGVDSVAFGAFMSTSNESTKCIVELYNKTDDEVIAGSAVTTNETSEVFVATATNFLSNFPDKNFDLGIRVSTETDGVGVIFFKPLLFLFRNE